MRPKTSTVMLGLLKATRFRKDNRLILREYKHLRKLVVLALAFSLLGAFTEGITVGFIASFLQGLTNPNEPPIQTGLRWFDVTFLATEASAAVRIYRLSGLLLCAFWVRGICEYLGQVYSKKSALGLVDRLRGRIFEQIEQLSLSFFDKTKPGDLMSIAGAEVGHTQQAFNALSTFIIQGAKLLAYLITMLLISWQMLIAAIMTFGLMSMGLSNITRRVREASFAIPKANKAFVSVMLSLVTGIRTIHSSATQDFERQRFVKAARGTYLAQLSVIRMSALVSPLVQAMGGTLLIGIVIFSYSLLIASGQLNSAELLTFLFVLLRITPLVSHLNGARVNFMSLQGSLTSVSNFLQRAGKPYFEDGHLQFTGLRHSIDFVGVDFEYEPNEPVLHNVTLSIEQGKTTALVGSSGAGKTTLADLIPRFYDPTRGKILIDGIDLGEFRINSFRKRTAIVSQDTYIFNATAYENIVYGAEGVSRAVVYEATEMANAIDFIKALPQGFGTTLGDRGVRLSGGQRQRIAIARALLRKADILILDEATSALDSATEKIVKESLDCLSKGKTVIAIAHRLSTISEADKVVVLEQGQIVEQGTYQNLLERRGKLWEYHNIQYGSHSYQLP